MNSVFRKDLEFINGFNVSSVLHRNGDVLSRAFDEDISCIYLKYSQLQLPSGLVASPPHFKASSPETSISVFVTSADPVALTPLLTLPPVDEELAFRVLF